MLVPKLLLPPKKIGCLSPKRPFLPQNMLFLAYVGLAGSISELLVGWLLFVRTGCSISRASTYFIKVHKSLNNTAPPFFYSFPQGQVYKRQL